MPTINIYDATGIFKGQIVRVDFPSSHIPASKAINNTQHLKLSNVMGGNNNGRYERLLQAFPGIDPRGGILPDTCGLAYYQPTLADGGHEIGSLYAVNKLLRFAGCITMRPIPTSISMDDFLVRLGCMIEKVGGWDYLNPEFIEFVRGNLAAPHTIRTMTSDFTIAVEYDEANMQRSMNTIQSMVMKGISTSSSVRKILRRNNVMARAWAAEMFLAMYGHLNSGTMSPASEEAVEVASISSLAIRDYAKVRGSRLDDSDRIIPALTRTDAVQRSFNTYNDRLKKAYDRMVASRINNGNINFSEGGPAFDFNGYKVNVVMAYAIIVKVIKRFAYLRSQGNTANHLDGNFWVNGDPGMPIIPGRWNEKHMAACRLVQECARVITKYYPVPATGSDGAADGEQLWAVDFGTEHADISVNATLNANIRTCCVCGHLSDGNSGDIIKHGETCEGAALHNPGYPNRGYCTSCLPGHFNRVFDDNLWVTRNDCVTIELSVYDSSGHRSGNARSARCSQTFNHLLSRCVESCPTCGSRTYSPERMSQFTDTDTRVQELIRSMANGVPISSPLAAAISASTGRAHNPTGGGSLRLNHSAEIWDNGCCVRVCPRCANISSLYLDPISGRYYSNIDNSPSAPEYGYKVPDPDGRWLQRCVGIEFETGPGSSRVAGKDEYLNSRCSDQIHVWNIHSDGSLMGDACEITTPPVGGLAIKMAVDAMFSLAKDKGFFIENRQAGMHVHCDITDLFHAMLPHRDAWLKQRSSGNTIYHRFCTQFGRFGDALATLSRHFVSAYRRHNTYCSGGFGIRSWSVPSDDPMSGYQTSVGSGRQAVCVHMHNGYSKRTKVTYTLENRIWPSSNSKEYTMARTELTQKAVDKFVSFAIPFLENKEGRNEALKALTMFVDEFTAIAPYNRGLPMAPEDLVHVPDKACDMLGISDEGREALKKLHRRFFYITYYAQEHSLSMTSPEIIALRNESLRNSGTSESSVTHPDEVAGIMLQKGFGDIRTSNARTGGPLADPPSMVVMDTLITSHASNPIATDVSDLCAEAPLSRIHH